MTRATALLAVGVVAVTASLARADAPGAARLGDPLAQVMTREYPAALAAATPSGNLSPESAQVIYDAARDLENALPLATNASCRRLLTALRSFVAAEVAAAEWFDRLDRGRSAAARRAGIRLASQVAAARPSCRGRAMAKPAAALQPLLAPGSGEAFTGIVEARAPADAATGEISVNGTKTGLTIPVVGRRARGSLSARPGPIGKLEIVFRGESGAEVARAAARSVWLLPRTAWRVGSSSRPSPALSRKLTEASKGFPGYSGSWVARLGDGTHGSWNEVSRFPAASTVKLGVMVAALDHYRAGPQRTGIAHELEAIAGWSSNLAANRLFGMLGGERRIEAALRSLGAASSTYTGTYRAGTSVTRPAAQPPLVSRRVTTARDLGSMLESFVRLAGGDRDVARRTGLSAADGRLLIGLLLRSQKQGDNRGLFTSSVPAGVPIAQKNGWISSARHTAAVLFTPRGPVVCVVVTYTEGVDRADAERLGRKVVRLALGSGAG